MRTDKDVKFWQEALKNANEQYESCRIRLDGLDTERAEIVEEMRRLEQLIQHVTPFASERHYDALDKFLTEFVPDPDSGLADAIRRVLFQAQRYMTPIEIRDILEASSYDLKQHNNPLASIHGILKRFDQSGEVSMVQSGSKTAYKLHPADRGVTGAVRLTTPRGARLSDVIQRKVDEEKKKKGQVNC